MAALREASQSGKYLFAFFFKAEDEQTVAMRKVFDKAMQKVADRAQSVAVNTADASEKSIVAKFDLERAPMPLVLALAPNGAITGGFPTKFEEQQLLAAFASPATEKCMKSLQDGNLVFLCVQNEKTKANDTAMKGVNDFKADERFGHATTIIKLDPMDKKEASFLADLQVSTETTEAITVFLAPPGKPLAKFEGDDQQRDFGGYACQGQHWLRSWRMRPRRMLSAEIKATNFAHSSQSPEIFRGKITPPY